MFFQRGCTQSTAEYELKPDGTVSVTNRCLKNGEQKKVRGTATVLDAPTNAVLEVQFDEWYSIFIPRARQGNYFIVWLAPDYSPPRWARRAESAYGYCRGNPPLRWTPTIELSSTAANWGFRWRT